jgi:hypothetical protein
MPPAVTLETLAQTLEPSLFVTRTRTGTVSGPESVQDTFPAAWESCVAEQFSAVYSNVIRMT